MTDLERSAGRKSGRVRGRLRRIPAAASAVAGGLALLLLMGITVIDVVARYVFGVSLLGAEDLATMSLTVLVAGAVVCAAIEGRHVAVDLVGRFGGARVTRASDFVARVLGIAATAAAALALFSKGSCGLECGEVTGSLAILHTPFYYALGLSMTTYSLLLASGLIRGLAARAGNAPRGKGP